MDPEKTKRRQNLKVIISEAIMVMTVAVTVIILAFLVSGYWINSDFKLERQGLLQISSVPTGADVAIDGDSSWLQRTNTSKVLSSGEHTVTLTKEGYDSWSKTINISEGLLYRIHYPRLFPTNPVTEKTLALNNHSFSTISPDHSKLLLISSTWQLIDLANKDIKALDLGISQLSSGDSPIKITPESTVVSADWDKSGSHILIKINNGESTEWILLDVKDVKNSISLSKEFGGDFTNVQILDDSSSSLLAIHNGNLHKIDIPGRSLSSVLVKNVADYDHFDSSEVVFYANDTVSETGTGYVGLLKLSDNKTTKLLDVATSATVTISRFYDDKYITILQDNLVTLYKKDNFTKVADYEISFFPNKMEVGHNGEFITMSLGGRVATLDMETESIREWDVGAGQFGWIDDDMIYTTIDGTLVVYDFDGLNRRVLSQNVNNNTLATITDDKWLYYFSDNSLMRMIINN